MTPPILRKQCCLPCWCRTSKQDRSHRGRAVVQLPFRKHEPSWQTWVAVQPVPQLPQLASSVFRLRQTSLQFVNPLAQMQLLF